MSASTSNAEVLARIHDDGGTLRTARYVLFNGSPTFVVGVILEFETLTATVLTEPNDDEILVELTAHKPEPDQKLVTAGTESPWHAVYGLPVLWAWEMRNQQGYTDGVRLEFGDPDDSGKNRTIELLAAASSLQLFVAHPATG